jgi:pimeloyl-ACP methyl ester carboxylesterase
MPDQPDATSSLVPTRLGRLAVQTHGSGPPAVLWPSLFVDSTTWRRLRQPLAAQRQLVLIDGPSHGGSDPSARLFDLPECAGAALDVLDQLGVREPVDWVGNAWGGHVGVLFARAYPERCRSLATIGSPVHPLEPSARVTTGLLVGVYGVVGPIGPLVRAVSNALLGPNAAASDPEAASIVAEAFRRADRRGMYRAMRSAMLNRRDLTPLLPAIAAPALIVAAADDGLWTPAQARAAAARLPRGTSEVVPGAGHVAPLFQSVSELVSLLSRFWAG